VHRCRCRDPGRPSSVHPQTRADSKPARWAALGHPCCCRPAVAASSPPRVSSPGIADNCVNIDSARLVEDCCRATAPVCATAGQGNTHHMPLPTRPGRRRGGRSRLVSPPVGVHHVPPPPRASPPWHEGGAYGRDAEGGRLIEEVRATREDQIGRAPAAVGGRRQGTRRTAERV